MRENAPSILVDRSFNSFGTGNYVPRDAVSAADVLRCIKRGARHAPHAPGFPTRFSAILPVAQKKAALPPLIAHLYVTGGPPRMAKQGLGKKGIERFKTRRLNRPKVDAKKKKSGPPQPQKGGVSKPQPQTKKKDNVKQRKRPVHVGAFGGGGQGLPHAYKPTQTILLVGEGNFSFTRALVRADSAHSG